MAEVAGILLAGGRSIRLGRDKPTLMIEGETLVQRHVRQLRVAGVKHIVAVCNPDNEPAIRAFTPTVLQRGSNMSAAVLTGLQEIAGAESVWTVCVNDLICDDAYARIAAISLAPEGIATPTVPLARRFDGGCLEILDGRVRRIIEKPPGGCPPGAAANIMVHRIAGRELVVRLAKLLESGVEYEGAINALIEQGARVVPVPIDSWRAIKTPADLDG
jgi:NDP-sugar pyrophosphorylase family protein